LKDLKNSSCILLYFYKKSLLLRVHGVLKTHHNNSISNTLKTNALISEKNVLISTIEHRRKYRKYTTFYSCLTAQERHLKGHFSVFMFLSFVTVLVSCFIFVTTIYSYL